MKKRARIALTLFTVFALLFVACSSGGSDDADQGADDAANNEEESTGKTEVEIFSWWTAGGEGEALEALINGFEEQHPDIEVINATVAGGGGSNAKSVLASRMQGGDPPSTFQVHSGAELMSWVEAGQMEPINHLYEENEWEGVFPEKVVDMLSKDGDIYGVILGNHSGNTLWYNKEIFEKYDLQPPKTFDEFFEIADKLQAEGITPLSLGDKAVWATGMIFEDILLAELGPENYRKLWTGEVPFDSPEVVKSAEILGKMLEYINDTHSSLEWQDASELVASGEAAMNIMGDWAEGYFQSKDLTPEEDYGWVPTPGTEGMFMVVDDGFGLPKGAKNEEAVEKFLTYVGSLDAQDTFNPIKGSVPTRIDADESKYGVYGQDAISRFKEADETDGIVHSVFHGSAAAPGFVNEISNALTVFVTQKDVDQFIDSLVQASSQLQ